MHCSMLGSASTSPARARARAGQTAPRTPRSQSEGSLTSLVGRLPGGVLSGILFGETSVVHSRCTVKVLRSLTPTDDVQVSVVVPTRNSGRTLEACLRSLRGQSVPCVVVVVDNHSTDATAAIARQYAHLFAWAGPERSAQRNVGAQLTRSVVVGFIDSDMVVEPTVVEQAVNALASGAGGVVVPERSFGDGFWAEVRRFERSFYRGSDSVEAARFFRRDVFESVGGFDEAMEPGPEDWDLTIRVRRIAEVVRIRAEIAHDEGSPTFWRACGRKAYYAAGLRSFARKHGRASISVLERPYFRRPWLIFAEGPRLGLGLVALKTGEASAVVAATVLHLGPLRLRRRSSVASRGSADGNPIGMGRWLRESGHQVPDPPPTELSGDD